jgi:integrase
MVRLYYEDEPVPFDIQNRTLNRLLGSAGFVLPERHRLRTALLGPLRAAIDTIRRRENEWRAADWTNRLPDEAPAALVPAPTLVPLAPVPDIGPSPQITTGKRLKELLKIYVEKMQPKSPREQELAVRLLCRFLGDDDPLIETITPEKADSFYDMLKRLPKTMTSALSQRPILDVVSDMQSGKLNLPQTSPATAFKKLTLLNAMFSYAAARNLMLTPNPFSRVAGPKDKQPQVKRRPMRPEDLKSIFSAPLFRGCADYNDWRNEGGVLIANHRFWLPLLGMATGCRLEEIGQLLLSDVQVSGGIIFLNITEEIEEADAGIGPKSVKTSKSTRRIPVHQVIIDAGFQEYCDWLRARGEKRLFPELPNVGKKTKRFSQWFNRDFRPTVGLAGPERTFHSFRHSFKDRCREAGLERDIHDALTGHADGAVGARYGDGHSLEKLKAAMDRITFPGFPAVPSRHGPFALDPAVGAIITSSD